MSHVNRGSVRSVRLSRALPLADSQSAFRSPIMRMSSVFHSGSTAAWTSISASISSTASSGSVWMPISTSSLTPATVGSNSSHISCNLTYEHHYGQLVYCYYYMHKQKHLSKPIWIIQIAEWYGILLTQEIYLEYLSINLLMPLTQTFG